MPGFYDSPAWKAIRSAALGLGLQGLSLLYPAPLFAQSVPAYQMGTALPNDLAKFQRNGQIRDAGTIAGDNNGIGANPFSVTDYGQLGFCSNTAPTAGPYSQICIGHDTAGNGVLTVDSLNGAPSHQLIVMINGVPVVLPITQPASMFVPGVIGDGATDNCAAVNAYIATGGGTGPIALNFPVGTFAMSCALSVTGRSLAVHGAGKGMTELRFTGNTDGVKAAISGQMTVTLSGLTISTTQTNVNAGVVASYTTAGFANRDVTHFNARDVSVKGASQATQSWHACFSLTDVNTAKLDNIDCLGINGASGSSSSDPASNTATAFGLVIQGANYPTDFKISNSLFQSLDTAIAVINAAAEGLQLFSNTIILVNNGVVWQTGPGYQGRPQLTAIGNNFNTYKSCISLVGVSESFIAHNLFYHNQESTTEQVCVKLAATNSISITDNQFENFGTAATTGVSVSQDAGYPLPASYLIKIEGNLFGANSNIYAQGIILNGSTAQLFVGRNRFGSNVTTGITDNTGAAMGQQTAPGRHYITLKRGANQPIPHNTQTAVIWDVVQNQTAEWNFTPPSATIVVPSRTIAVKCATGVEFESNGIGYRNLALLHNGSTGPGLPIEQRNAVTTGSVATDLTAASGVIPVVAGDTISLQVGQISGVPLGVTPQQTWLSCEMVE